MTTPRIAFIGAGNMAKSIIGGLLAEGFSREHLSASARSDQTLAQVSAQFGIQTDSDNQTLAASAEIVLLAVKPQVLKTVAQALRPALTHQPLIISVAAGITTHSLEQWLGDDQAIVRAMPNTPSQVRLGACGAFATPRVSEAQRHQAQQILAAVGMVQWLAEERLLEAVTAVSGSGPAYFFFMMEAMIDAGVSLGLTQESARELVLQTALGAAQLAKSSDLEVAELRRRVTSPGGTTEQAILSFERDELRAIVQRAMDACAARAVALSEQLGQ